MEIWWNIYLASAKTRKGKAMARTKEKPVCDNIVFIMEGDADELIMRKLIDYYRQQGWQPTQSIDYYNVHGFPTEKKIKQKLTGIQQIKSDKEICFSTVCCEFDMDVLTVNRQFEEPNWKEIEREIKCRFPVEHFCLVKANSSIEDWMLDDTDGLLKALNLPPNTKASGSTGQEKVASLFRKKNIKYDRTKGRENIEKYINALDIEKIRKSRKKELSSLEKALGINRFLK